MDNDHYIFLSELFGLTLYLGGPAFLTVGLLQSLILLRKGVPGTYTGLFVFLTFIFSFLGTLFIWRRLPAGLRPASALPDSFPSFSPFFAPAIIASIAVGGGVTALLLVWKKNRK